MGKLLHGQYLIRDLVCDGCGTTFQTRAASRGARFCSNACRQAHGRWSFAAFHADKPERTVRPRE